MLKNIPENVKLIIASTGPFLIVLILFLIAGRFGITKVISLRNEVNQSTVQKNILLQKLSLLKSLSSTLESAPDRATVALPSSNPGLLVISQLKTIGFENGVLVENLKAGTAVNDSSGLSRVDINFEVSGARDDIVAFLKVIPTIAPVSVVDSIRINESAGTARSAITVKTYWSELPKTLPTSDQKIADLTPDEKKTIVNINALRQPKFMVLPPPSESGKSDPFSP